MLLVHGNFAGKSWWRELLAYPPPGSHLLAPDLPGFGASPGGSGFTPSVLGYARSLAGFLDDLAVGRAVLVGHSFGGAVAVELAAPQYVPAVMLLSPAPLTGLDTPELFVSRAGGLPPRPARPAERAALHHAHPSTPVPRRPRGRGPRDAPRELLGQRPPPLRLERGRAHRYGGPVLVASGERDNLVSPSSAQATARAFPVGGYVNLGNVGHSPQIEAPDLVRFLLHRLLNEVS